MNRFLDERARYLPHESETFTYPNPGASEAQLQAAESRLGAGLDPQHRELLSVANGWDRYLGAFSLFGTDDLGVGPRWQLGVDEADRWFRKSRIGTRLGVADEPASFRMLGDNTGRDGGGGIYMYVGSEAALAVGTTFGLPADVTYRDLCAFLRGELTGIKLVVPSASLWHSPVEEIVERLAAVTTDELVETVCDSGEPWWRRGACAKGLTARALSHWSTQLFDVVRDERTADEVRAAVLDLLTVPDSQHSEEVRAWLIATPTPRYGSLSWAMTRARGRVGDLTALEQMIEQATGGWGRDREVAELALDRLIEIHGLRAALGVGSARELMVNAEAVHRRLLGVRLQQHAGGDLTLALADPEPLVASAALHHLAADSAATTSLRAMVDEQAPGHLWALATLVAQGHSIPDKWTVHWRSLIDLPGVPPDVRTAILRNWPPGQPGPRIEDVVVSDGSGVIDVRGIGHPMDLPGGWSSHCLLRIHGVVTNLDTSAYEGTVGRLIARTPGRQPRPEAMADLRSMTITGETTAPLREVLRPLLQLLTPGSYQLRGPEPVWDVAAGRSARRWDSTGAGLVLDVEPDEPCWIYPDDLIYLVPTESWPPVDDAAVQRYREQIAAGVRPAVIGLRTVSRHQWSGFVLDGHHKLYAYVQEGVIPSIVWITRLDPPEMTAAEIRDNFPEFAEGNKSFRSLLRVLDE